MVDVFRHIGVTKWNYYDNAQFFVSKKAYLGTVVVFSAVFLADKFTEI